MAKRIVSIWFPQFWADLAQRHGRGADTGTDTGADTGALAVIERHGLVHEVISVTAPATEMGVRLGQSVRDVRAIAPQLHLVDAAHLEAARALSGLMRWAERYSPWIAAEGRDGLCLDITGCAHLWGGEAPMLTDIQERLMRMGFHSRAAAAHTRGAAWALARYHAHDHSARHTGDAIDQEARATRARAPRRPKWAELGHVAPSQSAAATLKIVQADDVPAALAPLPIAALRLEPEDIAQLQRLGLMRIGELHAQPRAPLVRRFGRHVIWRLDQAMGHHPEPINVARTAPALAVRMSMPEPIGLIEDVTHALTRLLTRLCAQLERRNLGARHLQLSLYLAEGAAQHIPLRLARAHHEAAQMQELFSLKLKDIDVGFGVDMMRLEVVHHEPLIARQPVGHLEATARTRARHQDPSQQIQDLISRLATRIGTEAILRYHPCASHIPEKTATPQAAAYSEAATAWPAPDRPRPVRLWSPQNVEVIGPPRQLERLKWHGRWYQITHQRGPERIMPEWWLDDPNWRSGVRDYWDIHTQEGPRLWIYYAHGHAISAGWFCQGAFA